MNITPSSRRLLLPAAAFVLLAATVNPLHAQGAVAPTASATPNQAAALEAQVKIRRARVDMIKYDVQQTDARIESRMDAIIQALTTVSDSKDSRTKVARMKEETMKRLYTLIGYYNQKRSAMKEELRNPRLNLTIEEKQNIIAAFDARIEKRVQEIIALHDSMPAHKDYDRYRTVDYGWYTGEELNPEYEQNRRMTTSTNNQRKQLISGLEQSISRLESQNTRLEQQRSATTDPAVQKAFDDEIAKNTALIAERKQQRLEVLKPANTPTHTVALREAMDMDKALQAAVTDLKSDLNNLFARYNNLVTETSALNTTEAALAAQKH